uniref:Uncharacterized protein n=1 Tax=Panagrolaimus sp. ES5 TaxID=591445 RepID=A0AC34F0V0_9BILA
MSITDILLIFLGVIILFSLLIAIFWVLRTYFTKIKAYFQRKISRSTKPATPTHEIASAPILVSPKEGEDVEISLKSSRINSNAPQKLFKTSEYESDSIFESNLDHGTSPINLKNPSQNGPTQI